MSFKIGFHFDRAANTESAKPPVAVQPPEPVKSVVQVYFPDRNQSYAYYNDTFDLHPGDLVYVEGKLEGLRGRVTEVSRTFKIKPSAYKRVIAAIDTNICGKFYMAGSHLVTTDRFALPYEKVVTWFMPPESTKEEYVCADDGTAFALDTFAGWNISASIAERGREYYAQNRVVYLENDSGHCRAIVVGGSSYLVEFEYAGGEIRNMTCDCYCAGACKHEYAVLLQMRELMEYTRQSAHAGAFEGDYLATVSKDAFFEFAFNGKTDGILSLG